METPYHFIAIEGNIGAGKTTLCKQLADHSGCALLLESFSENPFLPAFYTEPERYALPVELFFMTERHQQLRHHFSDAALGSKLTVADYFFVKTMLFAKNNLKVEELELFQRLYFVLNDSFKKPDLLLYLHRPIPVLLQQIKKRGRSFEQNITAGYLEKIQDAYIEFLQKESETPAVILELGAFDFQEDPAAFNAIIKVIQENFSKGLHRRVL